MQEWQALGVRRPPVRERPVVRQLLGTRFGSHREEEKEVTEVPKAVQTQVKPEDQVPARRNRFPLLPEVPL